VQRLIFETDHTSDLTLIFAFLFLVFFWSSVQQSPVYILFDFFTHTYVTSFFELNHWPLVFFITQVIFFVLLIFGVALDWIFRCDTKHLPVEQKEYL